MVMSVEWMDGWNCRLSMDDFKRNISHFTKSPMILKVQLLHFEVSKCDNAD